MTNNWTTFSRNGWTEYNCCIYDRNNKTKKREDHNKKGQRQQRWPTLQRQNEHITHVWGAHFGRMVFFPSGPAKRWRPWKRNAEVEQRWKEGRSHRLPMCASHDTSWSGWKTLEDAGKVLSLTLLRSTAFAVECRDFMIIGIGCCFVSPESAASPPLRILPLCWICLSSSRTGVPLVDALMRELLETGFMANRGRILDAAVAAAQNTVHPILSSHAMMLGSCSWSCGLPSLGRVHDTIAEISLQFLQCLTKQNWAESIYIYRERERVTVGHVLLEGYIVASYLVFYLNIDWRVGADWFESLLLDHDVCSNYGRALRILKKTLPRRLNTPVCLERGHSLHRQHRRKMSQIPYTIVLPMTYCKLIAERQSLTTGLFWPTESWRERERESKEMLDSARAYLSYFWFG